jgi:hypothetical protein
MYAWKRLSDGEIVQTHTGPTPDVLFEQSGFGAVHVDKPIKGYLAVRVVKNGSELVESPSPSASDGLTP